MAGKHQAMTSRPLTSTTKDLWRGDDGGHLADQVAPDALIARVNLIAGVDWHRRAAVIGGCPQCALTDPLTRKRTL